MLKSFLNYPKPPPSPAKNVHLQKENQELEDEQNFSPSQQSTPHQPHQCFITTAINQCLLSRGNWITCHPSTRHTHTQRAKSSNLTHVKGLINAARWQALWEKQREKRKERTYAKGLPLTSMKGSSPRGWGLAQEQDSDVQTNCSPKCQQNHLINQCIFTKYRSTKSRGQHCTLGKVTLKRISAKCERYQKWTKQQTGRLVEQPGWN